MTGAFGWMDATHSRGSSRRLRGGGPNPTCARAVVGAMAAIVKDPVPCLLEYQACYRIRHVLDKFMPLRCSDDIRRACVICCSIPGRCSGARGQFAKAHRPLAQPCATASSASAKAGRGPRASPAQTYLQSVYEQRRVLRSRRNTAMTASARAERNGAFAPFRSAPTY
jgi:hypothetical protein